MHRKTDPGRYDVQVRYVGAGKEGVWASGMSWELSDSGPVKIHQKPRTERSLDDVKRRSEEEGMPNVDRI